MMSCLVPTRFTLTLNTACLLTSTWGFVRATSVVLPPSLSKAGHKQFLTIISIIATIINNAVNISNYYIQRNNKMNLETKKKSDFISRHVTLPVSLVLESIVATVYWPLRLFFVNLIMHGVESTAKTPFPMTVDMAIHLYPILYLLADHYLSGSGTKFKLSNKNAWLIVTSLAFSYFQYLAFLIDAGQGQAYPYPFLDVNEPYKSIIFVVVATITWAYYVFYQKFPPKYIKKSAKKGDKN
ncbi:hypothetical protein H817_YJM1419H00203 [Saccharomyces cerevisiae YJM1419]|nr:hypothetical protein H812_YJM1401H00197 [Saccharomyces cerevisiae YJM1401]AJU20251.1 hypothetical protein H817_YJM1419H00203 [Saccharomyces cerevisiae YJM1419]AJU20991.1 hypothetical protein H820_YJM1439H00198 [Saccharomyces cerevisiae YJM1439]AJU21464.1 hypothetical protein H822_YJM1444H00196 [Saccharomyces cerevisiae YJM1444]AJU23938.1 hypothetical protein H831_YJM1527H00200 [Saccharomyces cerevisiae YJM1527]AJU26475.1 hypothetical protein H749_YJM195H00200 [Saccharomyces cerevisiae YJM19